MKFFKSFIILFLVTLVFFTASCNTSDETVDGSTSDDTSNLINDPEYPLINPLITNEAGLYELDRYTVGYDSPFRSSDKCLDRSTGTITIKYFDSEIAKNVSSVFLGDKKVDGLKYKRSDEIWTGEIRHTYTDSLGNEISLYEGNPDSFIIESNDSVLREFPNDTLTDSELYDICVSYVLEYFADFDPTEYVYEVDHGKYYHTVYFNKYVDENIVGEYISLFVSPSYKKGIVRMFSQKQNVDWSKCKISTEAVDQTINAFMDEYCAYEVVDYEFISFQSLRCTPDQLRLCLMLKFRYIDTNGDIVEYPGVSVLFK